MKHHPHSPTRDDNGNVLSAVDWLGNTFYVGDRVLYATRRGNCAYMALGEVKRILAVSKQVQEFRDPEPGEEPNWVWMTEPKVKYNAFYDEISVQVHTLRTANPNDKGRRAHSTYVTPANITSLRMRQE